MPCIETTKTTSRLQKSKFSIDFLMHLGAYKAVKYLNGMFVIFLCL